LADFFPDFSDKTPMQFTNYAADMTAFPDLAGGVSVFDQLATQLQNLQQTGAMARLNPAASDTGGNKPIQGPDGKQYIMKGGKFQEYTPPAGGTPAGGTPNAGTRNQVPGTTVPTGDVASLQISGLGPNNRAEYFSRAMRIAQTLEKETGIPAEVLAAIGASESNYGNTPGNAIFGIKAEGGRPSVSLNTPEGNAPGGSYRANQNFNAYGTAYEAFRDFAGFLDRNPRYQAALASLRSGQSTKEQFVQNINAQGYAEDQGWANRLIVPLMQEASRYRQTGAAPTATSVGGIPSYNQMNLGLPNEVARAFCSPAAIMQFVASTGRQPNAMEVMNLAKEEGWTPGRGQAGPQAHVNVLRRMGIAAHLGPVDPQRIAEEVSAGRPVVIDTPGHYYQITGYNPNGTFTFGDAVGARTGAAGTTLGNLSSLGYGAARTAIYLGAQ
jgi:flagellar protein FlgJ